VDRSVVRKEVDGHQWITALGSPESRLKASRPDSLGFVACHAPDVVTSSRHPPPMGLAAPVALADLKGVRLETSGEGLADGALLQC